MLKYAGLVLVIFLSSSLQIPVAEGRALLATGDRQRPAYTYAHRNYQSVQAQQQQQQQLQQQQLQQQQQLLLAPPPPGTYNPKPNPQDSYIYTNSSNSMRPASLSAWGIITLIVCFILIGMTIYYVVLCYPLICYAANYDMMDSESTSSGTPTRCSTDFEKYDKVGNYSSRSTTPSKSNEDGGV